MNNNTSLAAVTAALLTSLLTGCLAGDDLKGPIELPRTCAEAAQGVKAHDGDHILYVDGDETKPWRAYCVDMDQGAAAKEYLTVTAGASNFSRYTAGGRSPGTDVETRFDKVRIDPETLTLDASDLTFAVSTGSVQHLGGQVVDSLPLGVAMSCGGGFTAAQVDVQGTPFVFDDTAFGNGGDAGHAGR